MGWSCGKNGGCANDNMFMKKKVGRKKIKMTRKIGKYIFIKKDLVKIKLFFGLATLFKRVYMPSMSGGQKRR